MSFILNIPIRLPLNLKQFYNKYFNCTRHKHALLIELSINNTFMLENGKLITCLIILIENCNFLPQYNAFFIVNKNLLSVFGFKIFFN